MKPLRIFIPLAIVASLLAVQVNELAAKEPVAHGGTVVTVEAAKLTIADQGKQQSFMVPETARVTINGKPGKLTELKVSMRVTVMVDETGKVLSVSTVDIDKQIPR